MSLKNELRKQIRAEKQKYDSSQLGELSTAVLTQLEQHPLFETAQVVLLYHSLPDEVNTHAFIRKWAGKKKILLPVVIDQENMELRYYTSDADLQEGAYGISQPIGRLCTDYSQIDLAVVPGMAFDKQGHRLGRGKGYYDRLLAKVHAPFIGICFPFQILPEVPADSFDISMQEIISL